MILGVVTIVSILVLLIVSGIKIWNVYNKGTKYDWIWIGVGFGLACLAFAGLFQGLLLNFYASNQEPLLESAYYESSAYFLFGQVFFGLVIMLTLAEVLIALKIIAFYELEGPTERNKNRGDSSLIKKFF